MYSGAYHFKEITVDLVDGKADWEVYYRTGLALANKKMFSGIKLFKMILNILFLLDSYKPVFRLILQI